MGTGAVKCGVETGILLEAGTNELEILIIQVDGASYGVNVAKVREVLEAIPVTHLPLSHPSVEGTVAIRGDVVQVVNLATFLGADADACQPQPNDKMLVMEFNQDTIAFRVHNVETIVRTSWSNVQPMPHVEALNAPVTGIVPLNQRMILMLDFEAIGMSVGMSGQMLENSDGDGSGPAKPILHGPVIFAEDSRITHKLLQHELQLAGCPSHQGFQDGQEAWEHLSQLADGCTEENIHEKLVGIISDVEMPRMDGFTLTRNIREHPVLKNVPVVLFSSIVSKDNEKKGLQVGADAQIAKGNYRDLVQTLAQIIAEKNEQAGTLVGASS